MKNSALWINLVEHAKPLRAVGFRGSTLTNWSYEGGMLKFVQEIAALWSDFRATHLNGKNDSVAVPTKNQCGSQF